MDNSTQMFETAFQNRLGQSPVDWIKTKIENGSQIDAIQYLFEITAAAIAQQYHCDYYDFEFYYRQYVSVVAKEADKGSSWMERIKSPSSMRNGGT